MHLSDAHKVTKKTLNLWAPETMCMKVTRKGARTMTSMPQKNWDSRHMGYLTSGRGWARTTTALLHWAVQELFLLFQQKHYWHSRFVCKPFCTKGLCEIARWSQKKMVMSQSHWGRDTGLWNLQKDDRPRSQTDAVALCAVPFTLAASGNQVNCA